MPSSQLSAETHTESPEETSEGKPPPRQRKLAGVTGLAWSLKRSGKKNSEKIAKWLVKKKIAHFPINEEKEDKSE